MPTKCTVFYGDLKYGWSETYYWNGGTDIVGGFNAINQLMGWRGRLIGFGPKVIAIRVSDPSVRRHMRLFPQALLKPYPNFQDVSPANAGPFLSDNPYSNILVTLSCNDFTVGRIFFGGVPDTFILDQQFLPNGKWVDLFGQFAQYLVSLGFSLKSSYLNNAQPNPQPITEFTTVGGVTQITVPGTNWAQGNKFYVAGCKDTNKQRVNRLYTIVAPPPGNGVYTVQPSYLTLNIIRLGTATLRGSSFINLTSAYYGNPAGRKRGRPFGSPHGKRKTSVTAP